MESKRRFGDRKDGRLIQSLAPFYKFMLHHAHEERRLQSV